MCALTESLYLAVACHAVAPDAYSDDPSMKY